MVQSILCWASLLALTIGPFVLGVVLEGRLYPMERQLAHGLGQG